MADPAPAPNPAPAAPPAETFDVTLPNGTVIHDVPKGTTQAQLADKLKSSGYSQTLLPSDDEPQYLKDIRHHAGWISDALAPYALSAAAASAIAGPEAAPAGPLVVGAGDVATGLINAGGKLFNAPHLSSPSEAIQHYLRESGLTEAPKPGLESVAHGVLSGAAGGYSSAEAANYMSGLMKQGVPLATPASVGDNVVASMAAQPKVQAVAGGAQGGTQAGAAALGAPPWVAQLAGVGAGVGAGYAASRVANPAPEPTTAPSNEQLNKTKLDAYNQVKDLGVSYGPKQTAKLLSDMQAAVEDRGVDAMPPPQLTDWVKEFKKYAASKGEVDFTNMDNMRQKLNHAISSVAQSGDNDGVARGVVMRNAMDDFINTPENTLMYQRASASDARVARGQANALVDQFQKMVEADPTDTNAQTGLQLAQAQANRVMKSTDSVIDDWARNDPQVSDQYLAFREARGDVDKKDAAVTQINSKLVDTKGFRDDTDQQLAAQAGIRAPLQAKHEDAMKVLEQAQANYKKADEAWRAAYGTDTSGPLFRARADANRGLQAALKDVGSATSRSGTMHDLALVDRRTADLTQIRDQQTAAIVKRTNDLNNATTAAQQARYELANRSAELDGVTEKLAPVSPGAIALARAKHSEMADALVTARDAAQKQFKDNAINEAMGAAQASSGKGDAESIQKAFKKFQKTSDYASMSPTERGMVDNIVQNQPLAQRVLQFTGGFAPDLHDLPHMVKTMAGLALGAGVGHIPGLIASTTITSGAKSAANAMAARQVARLGEAVRSGATPASVSRPPTPPGIYTGVGVNAMRQGPQ